MLAFPSHIERHLGDAEFSGTEIVALKKLLNGQPYTLRELAAKTGKSTGVLDQAIKKLMIKKIVKRTHVNGTPKYVLVSVEALRQWVRSCADKQWKTMKRKLEDLETYVRSIEGEQGIPEIQLFSGPDGIRKLHEKLLESDKEHLQYYPNIDGSHEGFMVELRKGLVRKRRQMGVRTRVIAPDTPIGRKLKSRDPFESRETVLCASSSDDHHIEKIISGEFIACIDHQDCSASLIRHDILARTERATFETMWNASAENDAVSGVGAQES